jgi:hypothetical protein
MKKSILAVAVWYFVILNSSGVGQVGPFATQIACENYRTQGIISSNYVTAICFSTTARQ